MHDYLLRYECAYFHNVNYTNQGEHTNGKQKTAEG